MLKPSPARYRTTIWSDYNASLRRRGSLSVWFDPDMDWYAAKTGKRGPWMAPFGGSLQQPPPWHIAMPAEAGAIHPINGGSTPRR